VELACELDTELNSAQVSRSPRRERSVGPLMMRVPLVPYTRARTIRGELPRWSTLIFLKRPGE